MKTKEEKVTKTIQILKPGENGWISRLAVWNIRQSLKKIAMKTYNSIYDTV